MAENHICHTNYTKKNYKNTQKEAKENTKGTQFDKEDYG